jgi:phage shock protein A
LLLSEKFVTHHDLHFSITEASLDLRTTELTEAQSELAKAKQDVQGAFELASRIRGREEEGLLRERELERKVRAAEEERRMADLVVSEYADLVRTLEGRKPSVPPKSPSVLPEHGMTNGSSSTPTLTDSYAEGKKGLQKLLGEFSMESERLEAKVAKLESELAVVETKWEAERKTSELDRKLLATVQAELVKVRIDDKTAAKMVSRYM